MNTRGRIGSREAAAHAAPLDAAVVRRWSAQALREVGEVREELDAINVYPVADGDTGTNLYLTLESADQAVAASCAGAPSVAQALGALAHGALIGARGNSGTILAQLLRGLAQHYTEHHARVAGADAPTGGEEPRPSPPGVLFAEALRHAVRSAYEAVARPVEGTMLTVAAAAADAVGQRRDQHRADAHAGETGTQQQADFLAAQFPFGRQVRRGERDGQHVEAIEHVQHDAGRDRHRLERAHRGFVDRIADICAHVKDPS